MGGWIIAALLGLYVVSQVQSGNIKVGGAGPRRANPGTARAPWAGGKGSDVSGGTGWEGMYGSTPIFPNIAGGVSGVSPGSNVPAQTPGVPTTSAAGRIFHTLMARPLGGGVQY